MLVVSNAEQQRAMDADDAAVAVHQRNLGVLDLALAGFAAYLPDRFDDVKKATAQPRMTAREQAAVRRDRQCAADADATVFDEMAALAFFAKTEILEFDDHGDGETIVNLRDIDV